MGISHSQPRFTVQMVRGALGDFAEFSHKAYNERVLLVYFTAALAQLSANTPAQDELLKLTLGTVQSLNEYMCKVEEYPIYLTSQQAEHLKEIGLKFIARYFAASRLCRALGRLWLTLRPKLHVPSYAIASVVCLICAVMKPVFVFDVCSKHVRLSSMF